MIGNKIVIIGEEVVLIVKIIGTIGVTDGHPYQYKVKTWTNVNNKYETVVVPSEGDPEFNQELQILQDKNSPADFLYVEVLKTNSVGTHFVGRGVTMLPTVKFLDIYDEVELYGNEKTGFLQLSLNLVSVEMIGYASS